jgi:signal transduction histidine kinase
MIASTARQSSLGDPRVAVIEHELRSTLAVITTSMFLLESESGTDAARRVARIRQQAKRAVALVAQLLDITRDGAITSQWLTLASMAGHAIAAIVWPADGPSRLKALRPLHQLLMNLLEDRAPEGHPARQPQEITGYSSGAQGPGAES